MKRYLSAFPCLFILASGVAFASEQKQRPDADDVVVERATFVIHAKRPYLASGFFAIENTSSQARLINETSSPACRKMITVQTYGDNSPDSAALLENLTLPAKTTLVFSQTGYHVMCLGLTTSELPNKKEVPVTFKFLDGSVKTVSFKIADKPPVFADPGNTETTVSQ